MREAGDMTRCSDYRLSIVLWYSAIGRNTAGMREMDVHYYHAVIEPLRHSICHVLDDVRTTENYEEREFPPNPYYRIMRVRTTTITEYAYNKDGHARAVEKSVTPPGLIENGIADAVKRLETRYLIVKASLGMARAMSLLQHLRG